MKNIQILHKRLGRASKEKLIQLLENSKEKLSKAIRRKAIAVVDHWQCEECHKNKKQEKRNKSIAYRSRDFSDAMAIDLTEWFDASNKKKFYLMPCDKRVHNTVGSNIRP